MYFVLVHNVSVYRINERCYCIVSSLSLSLSISLSSLLLLYNIIVIIIVSAIIRCCVASEVRRLDYENRLWGGPCHR